MARTSELVSRHYAAPLCCSHDALACQPYVSSRGSTQGGCRHPPSPSRRPARVVRTCHYVFRQARRKAKVRNGRKCRIGLDYYQSTRHKSHALGA